jgi:hypothetical protein
MTHAIKEPLKAELERVHTPFGGRQSRPRLQLQQELRSVDPY